MQSFQPDVFYKTKSLKTMNVFFFFFLPLTLIFWKTTRWVLLQLLMLQGLRLRWVTATYRDLLKTLCRTEQSAAIRKATNLQTALSSGLLPSVRLNSDLMQTGAQLLAVVTLGLRSSSANFSPVREKCFWFCERIPCVKVYKIHPFYSREVHIKVWSVSTVLDEFSFQSESPMTERKTSKCFQKSKKTLITGFRIVSPWLPDVEI